jgi:hypothetical protein
MKTGIALLTVSLACGLRGEMKSVNPAIRKIVEEVSQDRIAETLKKLESFETRYIFSSDDDPAKGIGAARRWIHAQFQSYSPRLQVSYDSWNVKKKGRIVRDVTLHNVVAVLPGKVNPERRFIVSGHYDSAVIRRRPEGEPAADSDQPRNDEALFEPNVKAPGVTDDGSGTAAVMELARVMSQYEFEKTIVFLAFTAEEEGLVGSSLYARRARRDNQIIDGVLNNDIIGSEVAGNGRIDNGALWIFSEDPIDSPSRELARYIKSAGERYVPSMSVDLIFRHDRFGRGGDHTPFNQEGYAGVRFTSSAENFANQHTATDTFANTSPAYTARVTRVNAAALASLALAPKAPVVMEPLKTGPNKGRLTPMIGRGKGRYDARLRWKNENPEPDLAGYVVVSRSTTAPYWEKEVFVGKVEEYTFPDVSIDNVVYGVKAIDRDGNESLVAPYVAMSRPKLEIEAEPSSAATSAK